MADMETVYKPTIGLEIPTFAEAATAGKHA